MNQITRARAYLAKLPPALAGSGGHAVTFSAACRLVEFGLSFDHAALLLTEWNETHCQPQWTEGELHHKLSDAFQRTKAKPEFAVTVRGIPRPMASQSRPDVNTSEMRSGRATGQMRAIPARESELPKLASGFHAGTTEEINELARARGLLPDGLALASSRGLLRFGRYHGAAAWFVLDGSLRNGCARRADGAGWHDGAAKSMVFRGASGQWPIGIEEAKPFDVILLCEGAPDLLAAFHFITIHGRESDCAPVCMLSAAYNIPAQALPMFSGKRVRIFTHDDATGYRATARWQAAIASHARDVDAFSFAGVRTCHATPANDLNGFAQCDSTPENEKLSATLLPLNE
jgi:hypothetical protein